MSAVPKLPNQLDDLAWAQNPHAACRGAPTELFFWDDFEDEPAEPAPEALAYCDNCPIRQECLDYALLRPDETVGVWGGTSSYQRRQLSRKRSRLQCPACHSRLLVCTDTSQLCLSCGLSWYLFHREEIPT